MDRITQSLLSKFAKDNSLDQLHEDVAFEHFTAYLLTATHYQESIDSVELVTGSGQDSGIDAMAVIINGSLISEPEEVKDICQATSMLTPWRHEF